MFLRNYNLNEGGVNENRLENKKKEFLEGENPKMKIQTVNPISWQSAKERSHVNVNWQNLRK